MIPDACAHMLLRPTFSHQRVAHSFPQRQGKRWLLSVGMHLHDQNSLRLTAGRWRHWRRGGDKRSHAIQSSHCPGHEGRPGSLTQRTRHWSGHVESTPEDGVRRARCPREAERLRGALLLLWLLFCSLALDCKEFQVLSGGLVLYRQWCHAKRQLVPAAVTTGNSTSRSGVMKVTIKSKRCSFRSCVLSPDAHLSFLSTRTQGFAPPPASFRLRHPPFEFQGRLGARTPTHVCCSRPNRGRNWPVIVCIAAVEKRHPSFHA